MMRLSNSLHLSRRSRLAALLGLALTVAVSAYAVGSEPPDAKAPQGTKAAAADPSALAADRAAASTLALSGDLAAPPDGPGADKADLDASAARPVIAAQEREVPLPPSGSFDDLDWEALAPLNRSQVAAYVQFNAMCDWAWAYYSSTPSDDIHGAAESVLRSAARWPALRGRDARQTVVASFNASIGAGDRASLSNMISANCSPPTDSGIKAGSIPAGQGN